MATSVAINIRLAPEPAPEPGKKRFFAPEPGKKRFFETKGGSIWVIFSKRSEMKEYVFLGFSVQTCTAYMR